MRGGSALKEGSTEGNVEVNPLGVMYRGNESRGSGGGNLRERRRLA